MEVNSNNLVERDGKTNAIIPVVQVASDDLENTAVLGNSLYVRDAQTNALIPVVSVLGGGSHSQSTAPALYTQAEYSDPLVFPEPLRSGHIVEFYKEDSLQETYLYNGLSWDPLSAESNQRDFLSAGRADSLQLWYNAVLALEPVLKVKYNALRADTYISRSDKSILSNYGQPLQSAWGRLKAKIESALSSTSLSDDLYQEIKTEYSKVVTPLNYYLTKEYEVEKRTLSRGLLNPFSTQGKLTAGAKVEIYPSEYTFRLFKNTNDAYMTFSLISRVGDRRLLLTTGRNGSCERKEIRVSASTYSILWSDLGKDTGDCIQVSAFDKDSYASFWIDLFVSYDTQADNADIYAISCRWASVI